MQSTVRHTLLSTAAAIAVAAVALPWGAAVHAGPMDEPPTPPASQDELLNAAVSYLERNCGVQPDCGRGEPLLVNLMDGWEHDVRIKIADLVAVRFGFSLPERHEQLTAPTDDWAPAFLSDYIQVTLSPAHSIEVRRQRHESWR